MQHITGSTHKFEKRQQPAVEYSKAFTVLILHLKIIEKNILAVVIRFVRTLRAFYFLAIHLCLYKRIRPARTYKPSAILFKIFYYVFASL